MKSGWQIKKLGDLVEVQNGYAFSSKDYSSSGHFLMRIGNVQNGHISTAAPKFIKLPRDGSLKRFDLSEGDILVSLTGNVGRVGVIQEEHLPAALNQRVARISIRKESPATRELLLFFLCSDWFREELSKAGRGAAQQNVSTKDLVEIKIPIPPQEEQRRIIQKLDEVFAGLAKAKENAEKNLQNARALFKSHLNEVFAKRGEGWEMKRLGDVLVKTETVDPTRTPQSEFDYIDVSSVSNQTLTIQETQRLKGMEAPSRARRLVRTNDVLFATIRPTLRRIAIVPENLDKQVCSTGYFVLRANSGTNHRIIFYFLQTEMFMASMERLQRGASYPAVTDSDIRSQNAFIPTLNEQKRLVTELDALSTETQRLEIIYKQKLDALETLKKSILHEAFSGNL